MRTAGGTDVNGLARLGWTAALGGLLVLGLVMWGVPVYNRYQTRASEANKIQVNELQIRQTEQLVQVEKQKAQIRANEPTNVPPGYKDAVAEYFRRLSAAGK